MEGSIIQISGKIGTTFGVDFAFSSCKNNFFHGECFDSTIFVFILESPV